MFTEGGGLVGGHRGEGGNSRGDWWGSGNLGGGLVPPKALRPPTLFP